MRARLLLVTLAFPALLQAQQYSPLSIGVDAASLRVVREVATSQRFEGTVLGARASASFRRLQLEGRYVEGSLTPPAAAADAEDLVDARIIARVGIKPWLAIGVGPHLRAFITPNGTARWSRMEVHTRSEGELINGLAYVRVDLWFAASATSNVQGGGSGAMGGEAGLLIRIPGTPTALEVTYLADRATFASGGDEFVEGIRVALVLDRILPRRLAVAR